MVMWTLAIAAGCIVLAVLLYFAVPARGVKIPAVLLGTIGGFGVGLVVGIIGMGTYSLSAHESTYLGFQEPGQAAAPAPPGGGEAPAAKKGGEGEAPAAKKGGEGGGGMQPPSNEPPPGYPRSLMKRPDGGFGPPPAQGSDTAKGDNKSAPEPKK